MQILKALALTLLPLVSGQQNVTGPCRKIFTPSGAACYGAPRNAPSISVSLTITPNTGTYVLLGGDCKCGTNITGIDDTLGNTWINTADGTYGDLSWVCGHCIGGNDTITVHFTGTGTTSVYLMGAVNYPDVTQAAPNDGNVGTYQLYVSSLTTPNLTTTNAHDRLVGGGYASAATQLNGNTITGYTTDLTCTFNDALFDHQSLVIASQVVSVTGTYSATANYTWSGGVPQNVVASLQALKQ